MALLLDPRLVVVEVNEELVLILLMLLLLVLLLVLVLTREKVLLSEDMETYHSAASVLRSSSSHRWMQRSSRKAAHTCVFIFMKIFLYALNIINFSTCLARPRLDKFCMSAFCVAEMNLQSMLANTVTIDPPTCRLGYIVSHTASLMLTPRHRRF